MEENTKFSIFRKANVFSIFEQCCDYSGETLLDFGGNRGNLIASSNGKILPENYTCLDVSKDSLELCKEENPGVLTVHWNTYHKNYNPNGDPSEPFPKLKMYDIIFANSVFTHMTMPEVLGCLYKLKTYGRKIIFTYIDPRNEKFFEKFREKYGELDFDPDIIKSYVYDKNGMLWSAFHTEYLDKRIRFGLKEFGTTDWFNYCVIEL